MAGPEYLFGCESDLVGCATLKDAVYKAEDYAYWLRYDRGLNDARFQYEKSVPVRIPQGEGKYGQFTTEMRKCKISVRVKMESITITVTKVKV